jgi:hypothetical protein
MDEEIELRHLDQVERYIADAYARLRRQRALIRRLGQLNAVADAERARAEAALFSIEDNMRLIKEQRRRVLERLGLYAIGESGRRVLELPVVRLNARESIRHNSQPGRGS